MSAELWKAWVEFGALVLALAALGFAWRQYRDARKHTETLATHASTLGTIQRSLSTRYIGKFPDHIKEIISLVERAAHSVVIVCDCPAYCNFTKHDDFESYRVGLISKLHGRIKSVTMICPDKAQRLQANKQQFAAAVADWENWKKIGEKKEKIEILLREHGGKVKDASVDFDSLTLEQLFDMFEADDLRVISEFHGNNVYQVPKEISLYFWIIDEREAIFTIPTLIDEAGEHAFYTADDKLITAFTTMSKRYVNAA